MTQSRREILSWAAGVAVVGSGVAEAQSVTSAPRGPVGRGVEGRRTADLGNGRYTNPVLAGDHPDPEILKDGDDYYATFSSFDYYPGVVIWHSRDLVTWTPIGPALRRPIGSIYAMDIARHGGRYFIYMPVANLGQRRPGRSTLSIQVIHADSMHGPWSEPIDLGIASGIDPGHVVGEDGRRYLYLSDGQLFPLSDDGLSRAGERQKLYDGWRYPADWQVENFSLKGPKLLRCNGWFYLFSAQGGTVGPPTSHMVVVARSRSVKGPWENCPHNPIVRTADRHEPWWSRGHGTAVEGPDGRWWLAYHGYENGFRTLGRQMLLEPMEWTRDGWPRATGGTLSTQLPMPARGRATSSPALSGPFSAADLGTRLAFYKPSDDYLARASFDNGAMVLAGQGTRPQDSSPLAMIVGDRGYEVSVEMEIVGGARGGLMLWYNEGFFCGLMRSDARQQVHAVGKPVVFGAPAGRHLGPRFHLKLINDANVVRFLSSADGRDWTLETTLEVSGYNHNVAGDFLSLRPALIAQGSGSVRFSGLRYAALRA